MKISKILAERSLVRAPPAPSARPGPDAIAAESGRPPEFAVPAAARLWTETEALLAELGF